MNVHWYACARKKHSSKLKITHCAPLKPPIYVLRIISVFMGDFKTIMQWALLTLDGPFWSFMGHFNHAMFVVLGLGLGLTITLTPNPNP